MDFARLVLASDTTGLTNAQRELRNLTSAGDQTERNVTRATGVMDKGFRNVAMAAARMAGALTGAFLSGRWLVGAVRDSEELERTMLRTQAIIRATGGVAGRTADQLRRQADELGRATLADERQILRVQQQLLTFRNIRGEVFDDAITAALDLSEAMGTDLSSAALQVARALEDPVRGVTALTRSGTVFTEAQRDMIRAMVDAGDTAGAQRLILSELEAQYGGAATAAAQGLGGAMDSMRQSFRDVGRAMVENFGLMDATQAAVDLMARGADVLSENMGLVRGITIATATIIIGMYTPAIVGAVGATMAWVASLITLRGALLATGIGALIVGAGMLIDFLLRLRSATGSWGEALEALGTLAAGVWEGITTSAASIVPALQAVWRDVQAGFFTLLESLTRRWTDFLLTLSGGIANIPGAEEISLRLVDAAARSDAVMAGFTRSANRAANEADNLRSVASQMATAGFDRAKSALEDLNAILEQNTEDTSGAADAARALATELDSIAGAGGGRGGAPAAAQELQNLSDTAIETSNAGQQFESAFQSAFTGFITGAQSARQAAGQLLQQLAQLLANQAFTSLFGGMFGGEGGGGGIFSSLFGGFRADGGPVSAGRSYIVGERGPELFTPSGSGQIVPNEALGGGQQVVFNVDARGAQEGVASQITAALEAFAPKVGTLAVAAVQNNRSRGRF